MRIDAPMIDLIDDIEDHCEKLPEELRLRLATQTFQEFRSLLTFYIGNAAGWIIENCSNCYETQYGDYGTEWQERYPLEVPIYMAMQMLAEMYSMLIRYTEIIDLGEGRDETLLQIKESYERLLLGNFKAPHHRGVYKICLHDDRSVQILFLQANLRERLLAESSNKEKETEKAKNPIAAEKARKHKEWLASPEYKAMRKKQDKIAAICGGVVAVLIVAGLVISGNSGKNEPENNQSGIHSSLVA